MAWPTKRDVRKEQGTTKEARMVKVAMDLGVLAFVTGCYCFYTLLLEVGYGEIATIFIFIKV